MKTQDDEEKVEKSGGDEEQVIKSAGEITAKTPSDQPKPITKNPLAEQAKLEKDKLAIEKRKKMIEEYQIKATHLSPYDKKVFGGEWEMQDEKQRKSLSQDLVSHTGKFRSTLTLEKMSTSKKIVFIGIKMEMYEGDYRNFKMEFEFNISPEKKFFEYENTTRIFTATNITTRIR